MKIVILPAAQLELQDAIDYYDAQSIGLGDRFQEAYFAALDRIRDFPHACPRNGPNTRQRKLHRFPYALVYRADATKIVIAAVAHLHREPSYWRSRLS